jgi:hypothetical protein
MIRHQTPRQHPQAVQTSMFGKQFEVSAAKRVSKENVLPPIPSLCDVVRYTNGDDPGLAGHTNGGALKREHSQMNDILRKIRVPRTPVALDGDVFWGPRRKTSPAGDISHN